ncbi:MAG: DUF962 domain-containing protein [Planctomycetota bacterium]
MDEIDTNDDAGRFADFSEFWPFYLGEHLDPTNRVLHVGGTVAVTLLAIFAVVGGLIWTWPFWLLIAVPVVGYGPAWVGHFFIEKNRPASFGNPLWSLVADFRMAWFSLTGGLKAEASRVGARCKFY